MADVVILTRLRSAETIVHQECKVPRCMVPVAWKSHTGPFFEAWRVGRESAVYVGRSEAEAVGLVIMHEMDKPVFNLQSFGFAARPLAHFERCPCLRLAPGGSLRPLPAMVGPGTAAPHCAACHQEAGDELATCTTPQSPSRDLA